MSDRAHVLVGLGLAAMSGFVVGVMVIWLVLR